MQLVWGLIVAWAMVVSAAPHGPRDHVHLTGVSVASAYHHPLRQRELPAELGPFVAPDREGIAVPPAGLTIRSVLGATAVVAARSMTVHARAPPAG